MKDQIDKAQKELEALWEEYRVLKENIKNKRKQLVSLHEKYDETRTISLEEIFE